MVFHCDAWSCSSEGVWGALLATLLEINSEFKDTLLSTTATTASCCDTPSHLVWAQMLDFFFFLAGQNQNKLSVSVRAVFNFTTHKSVCISKYLLVSQSTYIFLHSFVNQGMYIKSTYDGLHVITGTTEGVRGLLISHFSQIDLVNCRLPQKHQLLFRLSANLKFVFITSEYQ